MKVLALQPGLLKFRIRVPSPIFEEIDEIEYIYKVRTISNLVFKLYFITVGSKNLSSIHF